MVRPIVHVHGGSELLDHIAAAGIPGERLEWCDPVCSGPTPEGLAPDEWYRVRAQHLHAGLGGPPAPAIEAGLRAQDRALAAIAAGTEIVIWAGPELWCQSILMRLLVLLEERAPLVDVSLVDPGDHPNEKGCALGKLPAPALRDAFAQRRPLDPAAFPLARRAWAAFTAPTAASLVAIPALDFTPLPHLGAALARHLQDLPDAGTGLSTTETNLLEALRSGPLDRRALHAALAAREARPFLTDTMLEEILSRLGAGRRPLVDAPAAGPVTLTRRGTDVLAGYEVWNAERWLGGIHLGVEDDEVGPTLPPSTRRES